MSENARKPSIRFAGFDDAWEQREFRLFFDCSIPNNTLSRANLSFEKGEIKNVHYGDVLIKFGAYIDVEKEDIPCIIHANEENYKNHFLQNGDVIMADAAEDETVGKASEIVNLGSLKVVSGLHTIVCRPREKKQPYFLGYYINSQSYHSQLLPLMQGTKVSSLSRTNLSKTYVCYPTDPKEQAQIGNFFRNLDNLITLHQRKYDKLVSVKKSMLEKMFPKNGSNIPEIRFSGFTDPWEQRKLGDVFNFQYGEGNTNPSDGGDYPVYGAGGQQGSYSRYNAENSIIIGHMGDAGCISWGEGKHFVTYNGTITTSKSCDFPIRFGYYLLLTSDLRKLTGGSSLKFLTYEMIRGIVIHIPQYKVEQIQIGTLFYNLDNLITLHQRKLEKLKNIKKSMLEKMFV
jgi:type I restriction enzyme S subunit